MTTVNIPPTTVTHQQHYADLHTVTFEENGAPIVAVTLTKTTGGSYGIHLTDYTLYGVRLGAVKR